MDFNRDKKEYLWNIEDALGHLDSERLLLNHERHWDSWPPEEKNSIWGQRQGSIDHSELLCNKVLLKYKGDRESF